MQKDLSEKIPVISFLMMCEVMLYHCESPSNALAVNSVDLWWNQFFTNIIIGPISGLCMGWFFAITGFLLFRNLTFSNLGRKLKSRVMSLLIPYVLWQIIYIIKSLCQGNSWTFSSAFAQIFLLRIWPPLGAFWYVYAVFLLALLSPVFLCLFKTEKTGWLSTATLIVLLYVFWSSIRIGNGKMHYTGNIKSYFPAYVIGAFYGHIFDDSAIQEKLKYAVGFLLVGVLLDKAVSNLLANMALAVLPMLILFLLPVPDFSKNRKLYHLSFLIYATHQSIISLSIDRIRALILYITPYISIANIVGRILCIILIIAVNAVIHAFMSRFTPKTLNLLTGGRC